jgi:lambda family phage portal protein
MSYNGGIQTRLSTVGGYERIGLGGLLVADGLDAMRNRSRRLEENNVLAAGVLDRSCENTIGPEIGLRAATDNKEFNKWITNKYVERAATKLLDVRRMFAFGEMQQLIHRGIERDGDVAIALINRSRGPELQILEGEFIADPMSKDGRRIVDGVELTDYNAPLAYWIKVVDDFGSSTPTRIPARDIIFLHQSTRYNVVRGVPSFHGSYDLFDMIVGYLDAVVIAARIGASNAMIARVKNPQDKIAKLTRANQGPAEPQTMRGAVPIQGGMINFIGLDESLESFNPSMPTQSFPDAMRTFARFVGLRFGLTVERVLLDFSKANYSVSRSTALQEQKTAEIKQAKFNAGFFARFWPWFVELTLEQHKYDGPMPANRWKYEWVPPGRPLVEPSKDAPGQIGLIKAGLESVKNLCAEKGMDWELIASDNAEAMKRFRELGLTWIGDAEATAKIPAGTKAKSGERDENDKNENGDDSDDDANQD